MACLLLLGIVAVLHFAQPVEPRLPAALGGPLRLGGGGPAQPVFVLASVVGLVKGDPNAPEDGAISFDTGPSATEQVLSGLATPLVCLLLLAVSAVWWLRLPAEFDEPEDEPERCSPDGGARSPRRTPTSTTSPSRASS